MSGPVFAHEAPGLESLGFSPSLTLYLVLALLGLAGLTLRLYQPTVDRSVARAEQPTDDRGSLLDPFFGALGVAAFGLVLAIGWLGSHQIGANPLSISVFWVFWIGGQLVAALFGDWWRPIQPFAALARWFGRRSIEPTSDRDWWLPSVLLLSFGWLWLCWPDGIRPRSVAAWLSAYGLLIGIGGIMRGPDWVRRNDPFSVAFGLIARASPLRRNRRVDPLGRRELAIVAAMLGIVLFDAIGSTVGWADLVGVRSETGFVAFNTAGLLWLTFVAALAWIGAARAATRLAEPAELSVELGQVDRQPADSLAASQYRLLGPLALLAAGFAVAHETGEFLRNGQNLLALLSDPFAQGWNLLGTASLVIDPVFPSASIQAGLALTFAVAAVLGTYVGLHRRVIATFGQDEGAHADWAMLGFVALAAFVGLRVVLGA